ncbi:hypothetical protein ACIPZG_06185 [Pseudomonas sp. NPDC089395]|uniref:hypothetical protein n=1 Tax=unclassified Pseudomonas TaxID=196821 RepID=UPI00381B402D
MYTDAVDALKRYHQAQADGVTGTELERLRLMAEHQFQAVTDYQLHALGGPAELSTRSSCYTPYRLFPPEVMQ